MAILHHNFVYGFCIKVTFWFTIFDVGNWRPVSVPEEVVWSENREDFVFDSSKWWHATHYKEADIWMHTNLSIRDAPQPFIFHHMWLNFQQASKRPILKCRQIFTVISQTLWEYAHWCLMFSVYKFRLMRYYIFKSLCFAIFWAFSDSFNIKALGCFSNFV